MEGEEKIKPMGPGLFEFLSPEEQERCDKHYREHSLFSPGGMEKFFHGMDEMMKIVAEYVVENPDSIFAGMMPDAKEYLEELKKKTYEVSSGD